MVAALLLAVAFQAPVRYPASAENAIVVRELDGDGAPDILTSGNHSDEVSAFSLFTNRGDGTFATERLVSTGFGEQIEDAGDFLVASDYWSNGIVVYAPQRVAYPTATHGGPTRIIDYDGDGIADLVSLSYGSGNPVRVHLFRGRGDGTFETKRTFETGVANGASLSYRRMNGAIELLVSERAGNLAIIRIGASSVSVTRLPAGPGFDLGAAFIDVNGDGIADVIDTDDGASASESIFVTLANANGGFQERKQILRPRHVSFPYLIRGADLDGDGRMDIVVSDFQASKLYWFRGDGTGNFEEGEAIDAGGPVNDFAIADLNHDGRPDLVTVNNDHTISVIINRGVRPRAVKH